MLSFKHRLVVVVPPPIKFYATKLSPNDVLLGRGTGPNTHKGNCLFREVVERKKDEYFSTRDQTKKIEIITEIIRKVHLDSGRFLKKANRSNERNVGHAYEVITDIKALTFKVRQAFRYANEKTESSSMTVTKKRDCTNPPSRNDTTTMAETEGSLNVVDSSARIPKREEQLSPLLSTNPLQAAPFEKTIQTRLSNEGSSFVLSDEITRRFWDLSRRRIPPSSPENQQEAFLAKAAASLLLEANHHGAHLPVYGSATVPYTTGRSESSTHLSGRLLTLEEQGRSMDLRYLELAQQLLQGHTTGRSVGGPGGQLQSSVQSLNAFMAKNTITASSCSLTSLMQQQQQQQQHPQNPTNPMGHVCSDWVLRRLLWPGNTSCPLPDGGQQHAQYLLNHHQSPRMSYKWNDGIFRPHLP